MVVSSELCPMASWMAQAGRTFGAEGVNVLERLADNLIVEKQDGVRRLTPMPITTGNITSLTNATFYDFVRTHRFAVIHFWAVWNNQDIQMREAIESGTTAEFLGQIQFAMFDIDPPENWDICREHKVMGPPFLAYYRDGRLVQTVIGLQKPDAMTRNFTSLIYGAT